MEGLKDKERGEEREGRGGEGKERLSEHVRGGKRERKRRGRGCAWGGRAASGGAA